MFRYQSNGDTQIADEIAQDIFNGEMSRVVLTTSKGKKISVAYIFDLPTYNVVVNDPATARALQRKIEADIVNEIGSSYEVLPTDVDRISHRATIIANRKFKKRVRNTKEGNG